MEQQESTVRLPRFADDRWYSADAATLRADVQTWLSDAPHTTLPGPVVGLVAPHAGHFFSGHVAAAAFTTLSPFDIDTVILLGPDHRGAVSGGIGISHFETWRTPLGDTPINWDQVRRIENQLPLEILTDDREHSLEIELPFLQMALANFQLIPLIMGTQSAETCRRLAEVIVATLDNPSRVMLIASSDLSHFFDDTTARALDETTLQFILNLDAAGLLAHVAAGHHRHEALACGAGPIAVVIHVAQALGATTAHLIKYATSADAHPARDSVVGYAALAFCK
jgi:AmmeMemoRadiSam system protein B